SISTEWGNTPSEIRKHMEGYISIKDKDDKALIYKDKTGETFISYKFINNKLSASLLVLKNQNEGLYFDHYLNDYKYIGNINKDRIYQSGKNNTIATTKENMDDKDFSSIGFAPLISDEYKKAEPLGVETEDEIILSPTQATLYGSVTGVEKEVEVGFLLSLSPNIDEANSRITTLTSNNGRFETTLSGILDQETYYYQAYAIIDDITYYGEVRSFETEPFTYTVNGKEFQVIKVDGGPYGTISILQTEISLNDKFTFAGLDLGITLNCDVDDEFISIYESKKFFGHLVGLTGLAWRYPTSSEWKFAATGGLKSNNFIYSGSNDINEVAWYESNCNGSQEPGLKEANELGISDMSGNLAEITNDYPIKDLEANVYLTSDYFSWDKIKAYGGYWDSNASSCKTGSYDDPRKDSRNKIDGKKYALRLVYSHHINAYKYY
ncbi:MAG: formylglycine-generating enzyme family protein, partial [Muribaculaceae bacterium]|nr:formylglycine-generating enzyme family protein [Muribaculaceae bacterium]